MSLPNSFLDGLFAAVVTPTREDGRIDLETFDRVLEFLVAAGVTGVCLGGATGEYPHFETADRMTLIRRASARLPHDIPLLVGIGAPSIRLVLELGQCAMDAGSRALLLPMPMFFRYEQDDLAAFASEVARTLRAPCLLYNLPSFTNGLSAETGLRLLETEEFIVGIKDSSGDADAMDAYSTARGRDAWTLLVGDDRLLHRGLRAKWNGGISGVACFCPELLTGIYRNFTAGRVEESARQQALLDELIEHLAPFPTPWGIRIGLAARGIPTGPLPLPLTSQRRAQVDAFTAWFNRAGRDLGFGIRD
jgi:4-hydroxy-tetrahydrodipicolinate synthase